MKRSKRPSVLICSGFFESELPSYREYSYSKELSELGFEVTLMCGDQSQIWTKSRVKLEPTNPTARDHDFVLKTGVKLIRKHVFFRYSDFVLYLPDFSAIYNADIVHIIEFRQGVTLIVATIGRIMGKKIVYDHEQRGDRTEKWYSRVDSIFRRLLIFLGSFSVQVVRHTVFANLEHFKACTWRRPNAIFAPLGADPHLFYYSPDERLRTRERLGIQADVKCAIVSGKLHHHKRIAEVMTACRGSGFRLILVGSLTEDVRSDIERIGLDTTILLDPVDADQLRSLYNAADVAIFTTFTLSYWEALSTGLHILVPRTAFSESCIAAESHVSLFGFPEMFSISEEQYRPDIQIEPFLKVSLSEMSLPDPARTANNKFAAPVQAQKLANCYEQLLGI